jgi:hypothetical protein
MLGEFFSYQPDRRAVSMSFVAAVVDTRYWAVCNWNLERHADSHRCLHADIGTLLMAMASKSPPAAISKIYSDLWWDLGSGRP